MEILVESVMEEWQGFLRMTPRIGIGLLAVALAVALGQIVSRLVARALARGDLGHPHLEFFRRLVVGGFSSAGVLVALNILDLKILAASLVAGGGVTAVVLGFALREIGENLLAGVFLAFSRPFQVGDLIQSGDLQGTVRAIQVRSTHIRSADGKDIFIPSARILGNPLTNFTLDGLRRFTVEVGIDYGDDTREACRLLAGAVEGVEGIERGELAPRVRLAALGPQYVQIEMFCWVDVKRAGADLVAVESEVRQRCRSALMGNGFTVSANVLTNLALITPGPVDVRVAAGA